MRLAKFDSRKLYREDGTAKHPTELDDETAMAISGIEHGENGYKFKVSDKKAVADSLARHLGMFDDKLNVTGSLSVTIVDDIDE
jgi:phage terminase small subunit